MIQLVLMTEAEYDRFHVFKFNHSARAIYQKLGYVGEDEMISKQLVSETNKNVVGQG